MKEIFFRLFCCHFVCPHFLNALQSDNNSNRLTARAKMSLSRAQYIFMPANLNSIALIAVKDSTISNKAHCTTARSKACESKVKETQATILVKTSRVTTWQLGEQVHFIQQTAKRGFECDQHAFCS